MNKDGWAPQSINRSVGTGFVTGFVSGLMCLLVVSVSSFASKHAMANTEHCSLELDDVKRESCYQANPGQKYEQRRPGWPILKIRSYATGNPNASATRFAEEQVMCHGTEGSISIGLHCDDDGMKVLFTMGCSFGNPNTPATLQMHVNANATAWKAKVLRNQLGVSIEDSITANKFMKSMKGANKVAFVFTPADAPQFTATWDLKGFDKAAERVEELCPI